MPEDERPIGRASAPERMLRWSLGLTLATLRYVFQRVPLYRRDRDDPEDEPPDLDRELPGDPDTLQRARDGIGSLYHRRYSIAVTDEELGPEELIDRIAAEPNRTTPTEMASFETSDGEIARDLQVGDELVVRLPGPWNGPVRVVERTPTSLRLATLRGHMEAGEIEFRAGYDDRGFLEFEIRSWARSGDRRFHLLYERLPIGREIQLHMWSRFCSEVAAASGGVRMSNVSCATERID